MPVGDRAAFVAGVAAGERPKGITPREQALLVYADKLTVAPASLGAADVEALRAAGFDDLGIHDACAIVAYFAFVNRIADGLGVELEAQG